MILADPDSFVWQKFMLIQNIWYRQWGAF